MPKRKTNNDPSIKTTEAGKLILEIYQLEVAGGGRFYQTDLLRSVNLDVPTHKKHASDFFSGERPLPLSIYKKLAEGCRKSWETIGELVNESSSRSPTTPSDILHNLHYQHQLSFIGRNDQLKAIHQQLQSSPCPMIVLHGMPGVGRSELALRYAWQYMIDYPGGVCWVDGGDGKLANLLLEFAATFVKAPIPSGLQEVETRIFHCWQHWQGSSEEPVLIVLDDAIDEVLLAKVLKGLPPRFRVLITANKPHPNFYPISIEPLTRDQAVEVLQSFITEDDWRDPEDTALYAMAEKMGDLPLALHLLGNYLQRGGQDDSFTDILERIARQQVPDVAQGIAAVFTLTWDLLSAETQRLACLLSLLDVSAINWKDISSLLSVVGGIGAPDSLRGLLQDYHLLQRLQRGIYAMHGVIEEFLLSKLTIVDADERMRKTVARLQWEAIRDLPLPERPRRVEIDAIPAWRLTSLEKLLLRFPEAFDQDALLPILTAVRRYYQGQCLYDNALSVVEGLRPRVVQIFGSESLESAELCYAIATLCIFQGNVQEAEPLLSHALANAEASADELLVARVLQALAALHRDTAETADDLVKAEAIAKRGVALQERLLGRNNPETAHSLMTLSTILLYSEQYGQAEPILLEVLKVRESLGDLKHPDMGEPLNGLGFLYDKLGDIAKALEYHSRALELRKEAHGEQHPQTAESFYNLGKVYMLSGKFSEAETAYNQAINIFGNQFYGEPPSHGWCLKNLGDLYTKMGRLDEARVTLSHAYGILEKFFGSDHPRTKACYNSLNILSQE
jgi:tetratricopeptide (TPR) repeat protein